MTSAILTVEAAAFPPRSPIRLMPENPRWFGRLQAGINAAEEASREKTTRLRIMVVVAESRGEERGEEREILYSSIRKKGSSQTQISMRNEGPQVSLRCCMRGMRNLHFNHSFIDGGNP